jgi:poly(A) polymerase
MSEAIPTSGLPDKLPHHRIDPDAYRVVETLQQAGFTAYLVGGCVRDLLLGGAPKDFDITTNAEPTQIRKLFRNCRLIGRRFVLAHVHFGPKILEVATFRGHGARGLITRDQKGDEALEATNTFGTPEQDAMSRDFTVNGLFYDPVEERIIDHVGGLEDLNARCMRTIGDPDVRLAEDPVRILRAVKFGARIGLHLPSELRQIMGRHAPLIGDCPIPRVTEEIFRIMESGFAADALDILVDTDVIQTVLPQLARWREEDPNNARQLTQVLRCMDRMKRAHGSLSRAFVLSSMYMLPALEAGEKVNDDWGLSTEDWFRPIGVRMQIPVRMRSRFQVLMSMLHRMIAPESARRFRRTRAMIRQRAFPQALGLFRIHIQTFEQHTDRYEWWRRMAHEEGISAAPLDEPRPQDESREKSTNNQRRGGRRRGGRRRDRR